MTADEEKDLLLICREIGGRFDGILGVLAGLEVLRTIKESGIKTYAPVAAVVWTNEYVALYSMKQTL